MMNEPISSIMTTEVITVSPEATFNEVKKILFSNRIHHLPVVEKEQLVGIITSYDLVKKGDCLTNFGEDPIKDDMTTKIAKLLPSDKVGTAAEVFLENMFHGIPIVNDDNELVGIVTTHDILMHLFDKAYPNHKINWRGGK